MKNIIYVALCLMTALLGYSQIILEDPSLSRNFRAEVKSLDEFAARFNGAESHPEISDDSLMNLQNIKALFDLEKVIGKDDRSQFTSYAMSFCDSIFTYNIRFSLCDSNVFALAKCKVKFENRDRPISLILVQEKTSDGYTRWGIAGVKGLVKSGIIKAKKFYNISPVEHEIHFMGLSDILNHNTHKAFGYRSLNNSIDQLNVFLTLIQTGLIEFEIVDNLEIYCMNVPGFIFIISEVLRESTNSGWLISDLFPATSEEKKQFINNLFIEQ